jgi:hypothetical protein
MSDISITVTYHTMSLDCTVLYRGDAHIPTGHLLQ